MGSHSYAHIIATLGDNSPLGVKIIVGVIFYSKFFLPIDAKPQGLRNIFSNLNE